VPLEVFILQGLWAPFAEVRILRDLGKKQLKVESSKLKRERFGELNTETQSTQRSETGTDLEVGAPSKLRVKGREAGLATITWHDSMDFDYCQGLLLVGIVRMRRAEVEWMEGVGGNLRVW
jgi:hypothetical protein